MDTRRMKGQVGKTGMEERSDEKKMSRRGIREKK